jgi:hypothetical protein
MSNLNPTARSEFGVRGTGCHLKYQFRSFSSCPDVDAQRKLWLVDRRHRIIAKPGAMSGAASLSVRVVCESPPNQTQADVPAFSVVETSSSLGRWPLLSFFVPVNGTVTRVAVVLTDRNLTVKSQGRRMTSSVLGWLPEERASINGRERTGMARCGRDLSTMSGENARPDHGGLQAVPLHDGWGLVRNRPWFHDWLLVHRGMPSLLSDSYGCRVPDIQSCAAWCRLLYRVVR